MKYKIASAKGILLAALVAVATALPLCMLFSSQQVASAHEVGSASDNPPMFSDVYLGNKLFSSYNDSYMAIGAPNIYWGGRAWHVTGPQSTNIRAYTADEAVSGSAFGIKETPSGSYVTGDDAYLLAMNEETTGVGHAVQYGDTKYQQSGVKKIAADFEQSMDKDADYAYYTTKSDSAYGGTSTIQPFVALPQALINDRFFPLSAREYNSQHWSYIAWGSFAPFWTRSATETGMMGVGADSSTARAPFKLKTPDETSQVNWGANFNAKDVVYTIGNEDGSLNIKQNASPSLPSTVASNYPYQSHVVMFDDNYDNLIIDEGLSAYEAQEGTALSFHYRHANSGCIVALLYDQQNHAVINAGNVATISGNDESGSFTIITPKIADGTYRLSFINQEGLSLDPTSSGFKSLDYGGSALEDNSVTLYWNVPEPPVPPKPPRPGDAGWHFDDQKGWYYVKPDGTRYDEGWHWIEDTKFGAHWYYFKDNSFIKTNEWIFDDVNTSWYYVNSSGSMNVGTWNWIENAWYGFNWDGTMCKGWIYDSGYNNWFYCDPSSGAMYTNCWSFINGSWYGFWANGEMCRGWVWDSSYRGWFYCSPSDGHMYAGGWYRIGNKPYYFNASGLLI